MEGRISGQSFLCRSAVGPKTNRLYDYELDRFLQFAKITNVKTASSAEVESKLVKFFEELYIGGEMATTGNKVLAALLHREPSFSKLGDRKIPEAWRALVGWRKLTPGRSRVPHPLRMWCGLANGLFVLGEPMMGWFTMMSVSTYFRPGSLLSIKPNQLIPPGSGRFASWSILAHPHEGGVPSKTGEYDLSMKLDSSFLRFAGPIYALMHQRPAGSSVWDFQYPDYLRKFKQVASMFGVKLVPYQTRHSGASIDRDSNERTLP